MQEVTNDYLRRLIKNAKKLENNSTKLKLLVNWSYLVQPNELAIDANDITWKSYQKNDAGDIFKFLENLALYLRAIFEPHLSGIQYYKDSCDALRSSQLIEHLNSLFFSKTGDSPYKSLPNIKKGLDFLSQFIIIWEQKKQWHLS